MARILYGIHGTGHGHAMRGLTIARRLGQHEFLFVANDDALRILGKEFPLVKVPNLGTEFKNYRVDLPATIAKAVPLLLHREQYIRQVLGVIADFKPDVCMTDLEYFVPRAAERAGLPCLTLDHQHVITCCKHAIPLDMYLDFVVQGLTPKYLFRPTSPTLIVSFYAPPVLPQYTAVVVPPILRDSVLALRPRDDGHVLVYQSNSTHERLVEVLKAGTSRTCYVFGYHREEGREGNIVFMKKSEQAFLDLLEGASYVVQGGGHTLMTESLHTGKAIFTLPLKAMIEQRINALYVEKLGYGMQAAMDAFAPAMLQKFEENVPRYVNTIQQGHFCGNEKVFSLVNTFACSGRLV
ncbi:MAG: glycosyltransferase family protein [Desulfovibrionaceae bacterium]